MKHNVAKFFGVADEDEVKRERTLRKWQASTRRLQNRSFLLSRRPSQRRTAPRMAATARFRTAAEFEMSRRQRERPAPEATTPPYQMMPSSGYDSPDGGMVSMPIESRSVPPHPLDPLAEPPVYDGFLLTSASVVRYGDSAGNTVEENSSVLSIIRMRWVPSVL